jgi:hypothetical protein
MKFHRRLIRIAALAVVALLATPAVALAIPRDLTIERGKVWVDHVQARDASGAPIAWGVPYSQSAWADENGDPVAERTLGWRTDCSGFVSMCWDLRDSLGRPYSESTYTFSGNSTKYRRITKEELLPGDMMLSSSRWGAPSPHAILFAGWTDGTKTEYWALEQTTVRVSGKVVNNGTVLRTRPWGQSYYYPYRYYKIEDDFADVLGRVSGADRFRVAANASLASFPASETSSVPALVVASGMTWADALGGSALAGTVGGPLLLTATDALPSATAAEIVRLKPATVYVLGGPATVTDRVITAIEARGPTVVRLGGADRYATACSAAGKAVGIARASGRTVDTAYLATGLDYPDALAVSPVSARTGRPVLLTQTNAVPASTLRSLKALGISKVVVLGGTGSVGAAVVSALRARGIEVTRIAGRDRYECAAAIADHGVGLGMSWNGLGIASGTGFADALSGGVTQGKAGSVLMLTRPDVVPSPVMGRVVTHVAEVGRPTVYGGYGSISFSARQQIARVLRAVATQ